MIRRPLTQIPFTQLSSVVVDYLIDNPLPGNFYRVFLLFIQIERYGDRYARLPTLDEIVNRLKISIDTVRRAIKRLEELGLFNFDRNNRFISLFQNVKTGVVRAGKNIRNKIFCPPQNCTQNSKTEPKAAKLHPKKQNCNFQQLELPDSKASDPPQTSSEIIHTNQTGRDENNFTKDNSTTKTEDFPKTEKVEDTKGEETSKARDVRNVLKEKPEEKPIQNELNVQRKSPRVVTQEIEGIPQDLLEKLRELEIHPTEQVIQAIKRHHISQAYGAAFHVENTWETINNPRSVFLYQLPKQPIEKMGQRLSDDVARKRRMEDKAIQLEALNPDVAAQGKAMFAKIRRILGT